MSRISKLPVVSKELDRPTSKNQHFLNEPDADFWRDHGTGVISSAQAAWDRAVEQTRKEK